MKDNKYFYIDGIDEAVIDLQVESIDELVENVMLEAVNHMSAKEKADAKKYRMSAAGKKAIAKHLKKAAKAGYKVDKELSKKMKKVAAQRNEDELDFEDVDVCEAYINEFDVELLASIDALVEECFMFAEADKEELPTKDPETGEELDEVKHMSAAAKAKAKKYRMSAAGKRAIKKHLKKAAKAGYKVDKELSKKMKKVAKFRNEEDLEESFDSLDALIIDAMKNASILEACKAEMEEDDDEPSKLEICIEFEDADAVKAAAEEAEVEFEALEDDCYTVTGCEECLEKFLEILGIEDDVEDLLTDSELNEFTIHHMSAADKAAAKKYRMSAAGKRALRKHAKKVAKAGYKVDKALSKKMTKVAALRREAIEESLDAQFAGAAMFGSLNEAETTELKSVAFNTISELLKESCDSIVASVSEAYEDYVNEQVLPFIADKFDNEYIKHIVKNLNEQVDAWLSEAAAELAEEMGSKKLFVKSASAIQNEAFVESLLSLIKESLNIIPEQEDLVESNAATIKSLQNQITELNIDRINLRDKLEEAQRSEFVSKNIPESLPESYKEKLRQYAEVELCECESFEKFVDAFNLAVRDAEVNLSTKKNINEDAKEEKKQVETSLFDSIMSIR